MHVAFACPLQLTYMLQSKHVQTMPKTQQQLETLDGSLESANLELQKLLVISMMFR